MSQTALQLVVRRVIQATPEALFDWWTRPEHLLQWWGPRPVVCNAAEVDLRVGGRYRLGNRLADGATLWIAGEFELIDPPACLIYTWCVGANPQVERVRVDFERHANGTEITITHDQIADPAVARSHEAGWQGCLDSLDAHRAAGASR